VARRSAGRQRTVVGERGEIYLVSLDPTQGHEQQGRRPVLVVSPGAFNRLTMVPTSCRSRPAAISHVSVVSLYRLLAREHGPPASFAVISRAPSTSAHAAGESSKVCRRRSLMKYWLDLRLCSTRAISGQCQNSAAHSRLRNALPFPPAAIPGRGGEGTGWGEAHGSRVRPRITVRRRPGMTLRVS
jgi:mRNA-degrading endonuclease toxin of MazEF toxin-antitoxin module